MAGFVHAGYTVVGLIGDIEWGSWQNADQKSFAFGVNGSSVIDGGLMMRPFAFSMFVWPYTTQVQRDAAMFQLELKIGKVGSFVATNGVGTFVNLPSNVRLADMKLGIGRVDTVHQYWRQLFFVFEQLQPPPVS